MHIGCCIFARAKHLQPQFLSTNSSGMQGSDQWQSGPFPSEGFRHGRSIPQQTGV